MTFEYESERLNEKVAHDFNPGEPDDETSTPWNGELFLTFCDAIRNEWLAAREDFEPFHSLHEGYAVLLEETKELEALTFMSRHRKGQLRPGQFRQELIKECVQIATMSLCIITECMGDVLESEIENYRTPNTPPADYMPY